MDYEGLGRGFQLQNRVDPPPSQGLSQNGELQKSDLFLLRWIGSLPKVFPSSPKNRTRLSGLTEICPNVQRHDCGVFFHKSPSFSAWCVIALTFFGSFLISR